MIKERDRLRACKRVAFRVISGQAVLVQSAEDIMMTLNETGTAIWEHLEQGTAREIAEMVASRFQVDAATALADTIEFLTMLKERGIVEVANPAESG